MTKRHPPIRARRAHNLPDPAPAPDKKEDHFEAARAWAESIKEMVNALNNAEDDAAREAAENAILQAPLSVEVRSGWHTPGAKSAPEEYKIVMATGGPHVEIRGELSEYREPVSARLLQQNWFTPLESCWTPTDQENALLAFARQFVFED